jgi:Flp pilus assembly protein TadD
VRASTIVMIGFAVIFGLIAVFIAQVWLNKTSRRLPHRRSSLRSSRASNYGLAEKHFRRAVETHPRDAEGIGLAASYDRLRRFDLAARV